MINYLNLFLCWSSELTHLTSWSDKHQCQFRVTEKKPSFAQGKEAQDYTIQQQQNVNSHCGT